MCVEKFDEMQKDKIYESIDFYYGNEVNECVFYMMPKVLFDSSLFKHLSANAKVLYTILLDRTSLSKKNNWQDERGRVYIVYTQTNLAEKLGYGVAKIRELLKELESAFGVDKFGKPFGLIERSKEHLNKKKNSKNYKQNDVIYVKNISSLMPEDISFDEMTYSLPTKNEVINSKETNSNIVPSTVNQTQNNDVIVALQNDVSSLDKKVSDLFELVTNLTPTGNEVENTTHSMLENKAYVENTIPSMYENQSYVVNPTTSMLETQPYIESIAPSSTVYSTQNEHTIAPKSTTNNTKYNNTKLNNIYHSSSSEVENLNYENERTNDDNNIFEIENILLPIETLKNAEQTKTVIESLIDKTQVGESEPQKDTLKLFVNGLTSLLTSKKFSTKKFEVYNKLFNLNNTDRNKITDLAIRSIEDFLNGSSHSNIIYPTSYMCSCILNVLDYGNIKETITSYRNTNTNYKITKTNYNQSQKEPLPNTSYDIMAMEEMWNTIVPRLI